LDEAGPAAEQIICPLLVEPGAAWPAFEDQFQRRYQRSPDFAAAATYDAVQLLVAAVRKAGLNRVRIGDALRELSPWDGTAGPVRWDPLGGNTRPARLGQISAGKITPL
jgi:ABC-type branched-subunit amino acid transport system substrate-binding protein